MRILLCRPALDVSALLRIERSILSKAETYRRFNFAADPLQIVLTLQTSRRMSPSTGEVLFAAADQ